MQLFYVALLLTGSKHFASSSHALILNTLFIKNKAPHLFLNTPAQFRTLDEICFTPKFRFQTCMIVPNQSVITPYNLVSELLGQPQSA